MTCSALSRPQDGLYRRLTTSLDNPTLLHAADQLQIGLIPVKLVTGYRQVSMASQFDCQSDGTRNCCRIRMPVQLFLFGLANIRASL